MAKKQPNVMPHDQIVCGDLDYIKGTTRNLTKILVPVIPFNCYGKNHCLLCRNWILFLERGTKLTSLFINCFWKSLGSSGKRLCSWWWLLGLWVVFKCLTMGSHFCWLQLKLLYKMHKACCSSIAGCLFTNSIRSQHCCAKHTVALGSIPHSGSLQMI